MNEQLIVIGFCSCPPSIHHQKYHIRKILSKILANSYTLLLHFLLSCCPTLSKILFCCWCSPFTVKNTYQSKPRVIAIFIAMIYTLSKILINSYFNMIGIAVGTPNTVHCRKYLFTATVSGFSYWHSPRTVKNSNHQLKLLVFLLAISSLHTLSKKLLNSKNSSSVLQIRIRLS
jgi:hypothetical protein